MADTPPNLPEPGDLAPDFSLQNQDAKTISLSSLRGGRVVIFFYPKAMTSGCTVQANAFNAALPELKQLNAVVLGISPDPVRALKKFQEKEGLDFDLLCDEDHSVAEKYGVWGEKTNYGRTYLGIHRSQFIIDESGLIIDRTYRVSPRLSVPEAMQALGLEAGHAAR